LTATRLTGGLSTSGVVTLSGPAVMGGTVVTLSSSQSSIRIPAQIVVTEGQTTAGFVVTTPAVANAVDVSIQAAAGGGSSNAILHVVPDFDIVTFFLDASVVGGYGVTGFVQLNAPAGIKDVDVSLKSSNTAAVTAPSTVTVAKGSTTVVFELITWAVTVDTPVVITATVGASSRSVTLNVRRN